jgi:HEAT repeat protein
LKPRRTLEATLAALRAARNDPSSPASLAVLRDALAGRSNVAAGKAAQIVGQHEVAELAPELVAAFDRFLEAPADDPACAAKSALADALYRLGHEDPAIFLRGIRCVQMERAYDPPYVDTAVDVRGSCAFGLARSGYRQALLELTELLTDKEAPVRVSAARAMAYQSDACAVPLLRFKVLIGDDEAGVLAECFLALLKIDARGSLSFVARHLAREEPTAEAAGIALGESRLPEAFAPLRDWCRRLSGTRDEGTALLALATLRRDEAFDELVAVVRDGSEHSACRALEALGIARGEASLARRVREACAGREETAVRQAFERVFPRE